MKVMLTTQSGILFKSEKASVLVDPHFSTLPGKERKIPPCEELWHTEPDFILITHSHPDALDLDTLKGFLLREKPVTVLASESAYGIVSALGGNNKYVLLAPHSVWNEKGITFYSVRAEHTDRTAVGFILDDGEKTYYVSGNTLYNFDVIDDVLDLVEDGVDVAFLPISGTDNNMNARDAADFAYEIGAKSAVPVHYGLYDNVNPLDFDFDDALVLEPYKETEL